MGVGVLHRLFLFHAIIYLGMSDRFLDKLYSDKDVSVCGSDDRSSVSHVVSVFDALDQDISVGKSLLRGDKKDGFLKSVGKDLLKSVGRVAVESLGVDVDDFKTMVRYDKARELVRRATAKSYDELGYDDLSKLIEGIGSNSDIKKEDRDEVHALLSHRIDVLEKADESSGGEGRSKGDYAKLRKSLDAELGSGVKGKGGSESGPLDVSQLPLPIFKDLKEVAYGRVDLPKGVYVLSISNASDAAARDRTFKLPIERVLLWSNYRKYLDGVNSGLDLVSLQDLADAAVDSAATNRFEGVDFLSYLLRNPVSGDIEVEFGYLPVRDGRSVLLANVNKSNNAFALSVVGSAFSSFISASSL